VRAAEALIIQARTLPNPVFTYTAQDLGLKTPVGPALLHQLTLSVPILIAYLRTQEARVARAALEQAAAQADEDRRQLRLLVGRAYYDARLSTRLAALEEQAIAVAAELVAQTRRRMHHGDVGSYDVGRAQAEELDARRQAEHAARRRDLDLLALSVILGAEAPFRVNLRDQDAESLEPIGGSPDLSIPSAALERARAARPDLRAARAQLQRAAELQKFEARRTLPLAELQLVGGARLTETGVGGLIAFSVPLPLFDHNAGPRAAAAAQSDSARANLALTERQLALDLAAAQRELQGARDALLQYVRPLVDLRASSLLGARRLFGEGMLSLLDVIAAQRELLAAHRALAQAERDASLAAFRLRIARGEP
jgi:outer membrane protein TolC